MKSFLPILGKILLAVALLASFRIDLANVTAGGSVDFRNRITGIRVMEHGIDPYHFIWHADDPPEFCDLRNNPNLPFSKTTVTPALLTFYAPLALLPYRTAQLLWLFAQWLLLLGTLWLWLRLCTTPLTGWLVAGFVTAFTYTQAWRWEAERGQSYLLLSFIFTCWMISTLDPRRTRNFATGLIAGILITLRPPFLLLLPFIAIHRRGQLPGTLVGLVLGIAFPLLIHVSCWTDYSSAMQTNSEYYRHGFNPARGPQTFPPVIEGTPTKILSHFDPFGYSDFSAYALLHRVGLPPISTLPVLIGVLFGAWLVWGWWRCFPIESLLPGLCAWFFLADLFLPAIRYSYYDVLILNVVLAGIVTAKKFACPAWPCFLALPLGWGAYAWSPVPAPLLYLPALLFTLGAVGFLFYLPKRIDKAA